MPLKKLLVRQYRCRSVYRPINADFNIPARIDRKSTDILETLSKSIKQTKNTLNYNFIDDPHLINQSSLMYLALNKASGRKTAKFVVDQYSHLFFNNPTVPKVEAFSSLKHKEDPPELNKTNFTAFQDYLAQRNIPKCIELYQLNADSNGNDKWKLDENMIEEFFSLMCFSNSDQLNIELEREENTFLSNDSEKFSGNTWKNEGFADKFFSEIEKTDKIYNIYLCGLCRFGDTVRAKEIFEEMDNNVKIFKSSYDAYIKIISYMNNNSSWNYVKTICNKISKDGISPDVYTFEALFQYLSAVMSSRDYKKKLAVTLTTTMKNMNIEISLSCLYHLLDIFYSKYSYEEKIAYQVFDYVKSAKKDNLTQNSYHYKFLPKLMNIAAQKKDFKFATQINNLLKASNMELLGDNLSISLYYHHYLLLLYQNVNLHNFFEIYSQIVPNIYVPNKNYMITLLKDVLNRGPGHLEGLLMDIQDLNLQLSTLPTVLNHFKQILNKSLSIDKSTHNVLKFYLKSLSSSIISNSMPNRLKIIKPYALHIKNISGDDLSTLFEALMYFEHNKNVGLIFEQYMDYKNDIVGYLRPSCVYQLSKKFCRNNLQSFSNCLLLCEEVGYDDISKKIKCIEV
ncbi:Pentatricopeptide repeat domain-containing protein 3, mitochondrial [Intoshia linei]|uniref:Small ribosomal subunit protein mS39 n=1 Tax=Intoshia linei TaxID=1819745 RepID=A0A177B498_9BILA|nr:Pentatricopeptide repeat domain-containing protein 3, mitochondrial [Intoshia linei]